MRITHPQLESAQESIRILCQQFSKSPVHGRSVVIFGENGTGKTRLLRRAFIWMQSVAQLLPLVQRPDIEGQTGLAWGKYVHWPSLVNDLQKQPDLNLEEFYQCNLLVLDDIGAEHDPSGYGREQLYLLLNRREFNWNLISTNFPPGQWAHKFDRRISSRLFRNAEHINLSQVPDFSTT